MTEDKPTDDKSDINAKRQIDAATGGALAVTILNSGSWLALLSQAGGLASFSIGWPILMWGIGALLGTSLWFLIYRSAGLNAQQHEKQADTKRVGELDTKINANIHLGYGVAAASLVFFFAGLVTLVCGLM
jgi:hypothetical protein